MSWKYSKGLRDQDERNTPLLSEHAEEQNYRSGKHYASAMVRRDEVNGGRYWCQDSGCGGGKVGEFGCRASDFDMVDT